MTFRPALMQPFLLAALVAQDAPKAPAPAPDKAKPGPPAAAAPTPGGRSIPLRKPEASQWEPPAPDGAKPAAPSPAGTAGGAPGKPEDAAKADTPSFGGENPAKADGSTEPGVPPGGPEPLYTLSSRNQTAESVLQEFARRSNRSISIISPALQWVNLSFQNLTFEQGLKRILVAADLECRKQDDTYVVGLPMDLKIQFPAPGDKELDAVYRCRHLSAQSLADAIRASLPPDLRVNVGPQFLSPAVDGGADSSAVTTESSVRALSATEQAFKMHDVVFSGPSHLVRRALALARKFDRPRKQVRIAIRVIEVQDTDRKTIGVKWDSTVDFKTQERGASADDKLVDGIRLGKFGHSPVMVNATLNTLESKNKVKTLSNPTLTLLDGERSFILSGTKRQFPIFVGRDSLGNATYNTEVVKVGVYLQVAVQVGLNNDVVMSLIPQVTSVISTATVNGGIYPTIDTREAQTTVHAYSGETIVLGGLKRESDNDDKSGIPVLKDLPLLGKLFSNVQKDKQSTELMIILTPEIIEENVSTEGIAIQAKAPVPMS